MWKYHAWFVNLILFQSRPIRNLYLLVLREVKESWNNSFLQSCSDMVWKGFKFCLSFIMLNKLISYFQVTCCKENCGSWQLALDASWSGSTLFSIEYILFYTVFKRVYIRFEHSKGKAWFFVYFFFLGTRTFFLGQEQYSHLLVLGQVSILLLPQPFLDAFVCSVYGLGPKQHLWSCPDSLLT